MTRRTLMPLTPLAVAAALAPHEPTARCCPSVTGRALEYRWSPETQRGARKSRTPRFGGTYRYWPVLVAVSIDRPDSVPLPPETSVRMYTIRSPFLPEI